MNRLLITAAVLVLGTAGAATAELPTFEQKGFPITTHQMQVMGAAEVLEQSPAPIIMLDGLPASPHQVRVLRPLRD